MARNPKPSNVHKLSGAYEKNPQRAAERALEPIVSEPIGKPPRGMKGRALTAWNEIVENAPPKVLTKADRPTVEIAAHLLGEFRKAPLDFPTMKFGALTGLLSRFGMDPASRSKIKVEQPKDDSNGFDDL